MVVIANNALLATTAGVAELRDLGDSPLLFLGAKLICTLLIFNTFCHPVWLHALCVLNILLKILFLKRNLLKFSPFFTGIAICEGPIKMEFTKITNNSCDFQLCCVLSYHVYHIYIMFFEVYFIFFYLIPFKIEFFECDSAYYELVVRVFVVVGGGKAGKGPSVHSMRLCSCSWEARKWSCRSVWLKFLCMVCPSCSLFGSLAMRYKSTKMKTIIRTKA